MDFGGGEGIAGSDVCEADERMHQCKLPRVIELEARNALSGRYDGRFRELSQLAAIDKGLQDILLDVEAVRFAQCGRGRVCVLGLTVFRSDHASRRSPARHAPPRRAIQYVNTIHHRTVQENTIPKNGRPRWRFLRTRACPQLSQMTAAAKWIAARKFLAVLS